MTTVDAIISDVLRREGWPTYTDRPSDRGGPTKGGITLATLAAWRGRSVTAADVANLDEHEARAIYRQRYVVEPGYSLISDGLLLGLVVDCAVLYGTDDASPWLQIAANRLGAGLKVDGAVGPRTAAAVNALPAVSLYILVCSERIRKTGRIVTADAKRRRRTEDQALNAAGWLNRATELLEAGVVPKR